jgi:dihydroflavonol-4-reductase
MDIAREGSVLVTGAGGFVGSAVARQLIAAGARVRVIVRASSPRGNLDLANSEIALGDLRDLDSVRAAMRGVKIVFHVAADYRIWAPDPENIVRNNVSMTRCVMEAALEAGVARVVYTSSVATLRAFRDGRSSDEAQPASLDSAVGAYKRSKVAAERLVEKMVAERGLPAVIVNPSTPIGPGDIKPTPTGRIIVEAASGRIPAFVNTGLNLVHVDDVAAGHLQACRRGRVGERYILGGQNATLQALLAEIAGLVGRAPPRVRLPRRLMFPVAYAAECMALLTRREPMATVDGVRMAKYYMYFSSGKAERELGYSARPYSEGLKDAVAWFRAANRLPGVS